jgi:hypothetical protein
MTITIKDETAEFKVALETLSRIKGDNNQQEELATRVRYIARRVLGRGKS